MSGSTGCNTFSGHYEAEVGRLTWSEGELAFTVMGCNPASSKGKQEAFLRKWLVQGADYT